MKLNTNPLKKKYPIIIRVAGFTGIILLNTTIRRSDIKDKVLLLSAILQIFSLALRNYQYSYITSFELYSSIGLSIFFIWLVLQNRNAKAKDRVK